MKSCQGSCCTWTWHLSQPLSILVWLHMVAKNKPGAACCLRWPKNPTNVFMPSHFLALSTDPCTWLYFQLIGCFQGRDTLWGVGVGRIQSPAKRSFHFLIANHFLEPHKSFIFSGKSVHLALSGYGYVIFFRTASVFLIPLFLTDLSVRQGNYYVIYSRIIALHTSPKWDHVITAVSPIVSTLLLLEKYPSPLFLKNE